MGIDVAGAGDDEIVLTARIDGIILEQHSWRDADSRGQVLAAHPVSLVGQLSTVSRLAGS